MRITGGAARSIVLSVPAYDLRPATDATRERLFNSIGPAIQNATVIDCFAGTGAYGLEAISRGAKSCLLIDNHPQAIKTLEINIQKVCKSAQRTESICSTRSDNLLSINVESLPISDFIFFDPPYPLWDTHAQALWQLLNNLGYHMPSATLAMEYPSQLTLDLSCTWTINRTLTHPKGHNQPCCALLRIDS